MSGGAIPVRDSASQISETSTAVISSNSIPSFGVNVEPSQNDFAQLVLCGEIYRNGHWNRSSCCNCGGLVKGNAASAMLIPVSSKSRTSLIEEANLASVPSWPGVNITTSSPPMPFSESKSQLCVLINSCRLVWRWSLAKSTGNRFTISECSDSSGSSRSSGESPSSKDQKSPINRIVPSEN